MDSQSVGQLVALAITGGGYFLCRRHRRWQEEQNELFLDPNFASLSPSEVADYLRDIDAPAYVLTEGQLVLAPDDSQGNRLLASLETRDRVYNNYDAKKDEWNRSTEREFSRFRTGKIDLDDDDMKSPRTVNGNGGDDGPPQYYRLSMDTETYNSQLRSLTTERGRLVLDEVDYSNPDGSNGNPGLSLNFDDRGWRLNLGRDEEWRDEVKRNGDIRRFMGVHRRRWELSASDVGLVTVAGVAQHKTREKSVIQLGARDYDVKSLQHARVSTADESSQLLVESKRLRQTHPKFDPEAHMVQGTMVDFRDSCRNRVKTSALFEKIFGVLAGLAVAWIGYSKFVR